MSVQDLVRRRPVRSSSSTISTQGSVGDNPLFSYPHLHVDESDDDEHTHTAHDLFDDPRHTTLRTMESTWTPHPLTAPSKAPTVLDGSIPTRFGVSMGVFLISLFGKPCVYAFMYLPDQLVQPCLSHPYRKVSSIYGSPRLSSFWASILERG